MTDQQPKDRGAGDGTEPYAGFEGTVGRVFATSESHWPERPQHREGAPNIVVMLADDLGFADLGCYGSEIDTPNLDRIAAEGLRYTNFHSTPMCSPTRAALLTGLEPHSAGVATVAHSDPGFPGYAMEIAENVATLPEQLRDHGYATFMLGKWHLTKDAHQSEAGPKDSWPVQRGFERYYGFLDGFTNLFAPHALVEDNHRVRNDEYPEDFYLTDDMTDRAIDMIRENKASNPRQPFFCYFSHGAVHAPLHAKAPDIAKYEGRYRAGWDAVRQARYERQQELGVVDEGAELAPRNTEADHDVPPWDELSADEQRLFARYMEVYAAMVDNIDQNVGRLRAALEEMGEWDNTVFLFTSDNGGSREGEEQGTSCYLRMLNTMVEDSFEHDLGLIDEMGGPTTWPHYPRGWAQASNTPFRLFKINTHRGGHSVPFIVSWPAGLDDPGALRRQYTYVTDVVPTLLELAGVPAATERDGRPVKPIAGTSFQPTLGDADAPSRHTEQVVEMIGNRGFYRDGWEAVALHQANTAFADDRWELFDLANDPTQVHDLAEAEPEKLAELLEAWEDAAWANQIFPLDEGTGLKYLLRPPTEEALEDPVTIFRGTPQLERYRSYKLIQMRSFTADLDLGDGLQDGDEGILLAHGDQGGGYSLSLQDGELVYAHNAYGTLHHLRVPRPQAGTRELTLSVEAPGKWRWNVRLLADGAELDSIDDLEMIAFMAPFEGIDVGLDRASPVDWALYERHGAFPFTGTVRSVRYTPGELAPDAGSRWLDVLRKMGSRFE